MKIERREVHASIMRERVWEVVERELTTLDNPGLCIFCGEDAEGVEGDAEAEG
jgi:hypothetical protein